MVYIYIKIQKSLSDVYHEKQNYKITRNTFLLENVYIPICVKKVFTIRFIRYNLNNN